MGELLGFVLSARFSGTQGAASDTAPPEVSPLLEQFRITKVKAVALPEAYDAERGLAAALTAAGHVAELQNDYRHLTLGVAADGGRLDTAPAGVGIPVSFNSGFKWLVQVPQLVNDDSTVTVTWLATETRTSAGKKLAVLA
ncbi:hypothetical protein [Streptomyces halstedii]|uniref:Uncharacterized protein n=1 Tax=Streptomyces halstedii TaxID=1944 RepID=A0A6N9UIH3_STRHA|nr:hypothetical protein [Streptomyces halstedii]NEA20725.1 hypothetical protein [Streptomyces halstedii]